MTKLINIERINDIQSTRICLGCIRTGASNETSGGCLNKEHDRIEYIDTTQLNMVLGEHGEELDRKELVAMKASLEHVKTLLEDSYNTNAKHIIRVLARLEKGRYGYKERSPATQFIQYKGPKSNNTP